MWKDKRFAVSLLALTTGHVTACAVDDTVPPPLVVRDAAGGNVGAGGKAGSVATSTSSAVGSGAAGTTGATGVGGSGASGSAGAGSGGKGGSAGSSGSTGGSAGAGGRTDGGGGTGGGSTDAATDRGSDSSVSDAAADAPGSDASDAVVEACIAESDTLLCARAQKNCGSFVGLDNCGAPRRVLACGTCLGAGAVCGGGGTLNVCPGTDPVNRAQGGTVLSSNPTSPPFFATEADTKAFDNDAATKWYVRGNATPTIVYDFAGTNAYAITSYSITSGNDAPDRDPASWVFQGSNAANLSTWTTLDMRTNQTFAGRGQTNLYTFANTAGYLVYRLMVTANNGNTNLGGEFQVAEIQLFGAPVVVPPDPDAAAGDAGTASDASAEAADVGSAADAGTDAAVD